MPALGSYGSVRGRLATAVPTANAGPGVCLTLAMGRHPKPFTIADIALASTMRDVNPRRSLMTGDTRLLCHLSYWQPPVRGSLIRFPILFSRVDNEALTARLKDAENVD